MKQLRPHFVYNKKQRNGVFCFLMILVLVQVIYMFVLKYSSNIIVDDFEVQRLIAQIDSLKKHNKDVFKKYTLNPNFITDEKGYLLGMSVSEIDRLHQYRNKNKWLNTNIDFQRITGVSDSLMIVLKPLFKFPSKSLQKFQKKKSTSIKRTEIKMRSINTATAIELKKIYGIGEKLSQRIVKYRNRLGGYSKIDQLDEVYGLKDKALQNLKQSYIVFSQPEIKKIDINTASFKDVLSIVYLDYETTKLIFKYKNSVGEVYDLKELKKIQGFPIDKFDRIALYLQTE